jgi:hypothetical protein
VSKAEQEKRKAAERLERLTAEAKSHTFDEGTETDLAALNAAFLVGCFIIRL